MNRNICLIVLLMILPTQANAWGTKAHEMITEHGASLAGENVLKNCKLTIKNLSEHSIDPDTKWKRDRRRHPDEREAHFFHLDRQPIDWKSKSSTPDIRNGYLPYKIVSWFERAKKLKSDENWTDLAETMYGVVHYLGDITMPLHLTSDFDGQNVGLDGVHSQWESKMLYRYIDDFNNDLKLTLKNHGIPKLWQNLKYRDIIYTIAEQSYSKVTALYSSAAPALIYGTRRNQKHKKPRFSKPLLKIHTGKLATEQLAVASRLIGHTIIEICSNEK